MGNLAEMPPIFPGQLESYGMAGSWTIPSTTRKDKPPNGLEMSRPASPRLVSHEIQRPGWPGRLHRVVRQPGDTELEPTRRPSGCDTRQPTLRVVATGNRRYQ